MAYATVAIRSPSTIKSGITAMGGTIGFGNLIATDKIIVFDI